MSAVRVSDPPLQSECPAEPQADEPVINFEQAARTAAMVAPGNVRFEGIDRVFKWMQELHDEAQPATFVSWYELLFAFQIYTGEWGVTSVSTHGNWSFYQRGVAYECQKACRLFACFLTKVIRVQSPQFRPVFGKPYNHRFQCWAMGLRLQMSHTVRVTMETWMAATLGDAHIEQLSTAFAASDPAALHISPVRATARKDGLHRYF